MYNFFNNHKIVQTNLKNAFQVQIEHKTFNKGVASYILINLPSENEKLAINDKEMFVVAHHYTILQKEDKKTNSIYHYTLELKDCENKLYKTHFYFDRLDRITVEPKLLKDGKFIPINNNGMKAICAYSFPSTYVISTIREAHKEEIRLQLDQIESTEKELANLTNNVEEKKSEYIAMIEAQINSLKMLETMGHPLHINERKFYERLLLKLNEVVIDTNIEKISVDESIHQMDISEKSKILQNRRFSKTRNLQQAKVKTIKESNELSDQSIIKAGKQYILKYDQSQSQKSRKLIEEMINHVVVLLSIQLFSSDIVNHGLLFELKSALSARIRDYFNEDVLKDELYLLAIKANIIPLSDTFIIETIKKDNVVLIEKMLNCNLFSDSTKINLLGANSNFTLVEWCVYFNAVNCFEFLLNNKFSLDYINNEKESPFFMLLTDISKAMKFSPFLKYDAVEKLSIRLLGMLEKRTKFSCKDDLLWFTVRKKQIETLGKIFTLFRKDKKYKYLYFNSIDFSELNPEILESFQHHLGAQKVYLRYLEAFHEDIKSTPLQSFLRRQREIGNGQKESLKQWIKDLNSMSVDNAISDIMDGYDKIIESIEHANDATILNAFNNLRIEEQLPSSKVNASLTASSNKRKNNITNL